MTIMKSPPPYPTEPDTGFINIGEDALKPGDQIRVRVDDTYTHLYTVLSVEHEESAYLYDRETEEYSEFDTDEIQNLVSDSNAYHWSLLTRHEVALPDSLTDTLVVFLYAVEHKEAPDNSRPVTLLWSITEQRPVKNLPEMDGIAPAANFQELRQEIENPSIDDLVELYDDVLDVEDILDEVVIVGEYNARQFYSLSNNPSYGKEWEEELESRGNLVSDSIELGNETY